MSTEIPVEQKALILPAKQAPLVVGPWPVPKPAPGEVLVRAEAVGLNPVDTYVQSTGVFVTEFPDVLGWEAAGTVVQLGEGVTSLAVGDKVLHPGVIGHTTTFKQYNVIPADLAAKIPKNLSVDHAAAVPLCLNTAALGLYGPTGVWRGGAGLTPPWEEGGRGKYKDQPIVIFGGSSNVGQYAIQLARLSGFSPIITTASLTNTNLLKGLGATHVIDRHNPLSDLPNAVKEITSQPIDLIYAAVALPDVQNAAYDLLAEGGTLVITFYSAVEESKLVPTKTIADIFGNPFLPDRKDIVTSLYKHVPELFESGELKVGRIEILSGGLAGIPDGLERLEPRGEVHALKLIARPQETA